MHQLLDQVPSCASEIVENYAKRAQTIGEYGTKWSWEFNELQEFLRICLENVLEQCSVSLFVDALDECGQDEAIELVRFLKRLLSNKRQPLNRFLGCFACRPYPIGYASDRYKGLEIRVENENSSDIETYVSQELRECHLDTSDLATTILAKAKGSFLWLSFTIFKAKN